MNIALLALLAACGAAGDGAPAAATAPSTPPSAAEPRLLDFADQPMFFKVADSALPARTEAEVRKCPPAGGLASFLPVPREKQCATGRSLCCEQPDDGEACYYFVGDRLTGFVVFSDDGNHMVWGSVPVDCV